MGKAVEGGGGAWVVGLKAKRALAGVLGPWMTWVTWHVDGIRQGAAGAVSAGGEEQRPPSSSSSASLASRFGA